MNIKNKFLRSFQIKLSLLIIFISCFLSCDRNPGKFTLGEEFIESRTDFSVIDTFSVKLSTVILDTMVTSGTGNMLIGNYQDEVFGKIVCRSYFQIGLPDSIDVEDKDIYDSLKLVIKYNQYSCGDTTRSQKIRVHQLIENIEYVNNEVITGQTSFNFNPEPIGSLYYTPQPDNEIDTLAIKINDNIGYDLFTKLGDGAEVLTDDGTFIDYFHGLVLVPDEAYQGAIIGFDASEANVRLILYSHRGTYAIEKIYHEFKLVDDTKQFNNIIHDFSSTRLNPLVQQNYELASNNTGGLSYLLGGVGLLINVKFPSFQEILLRENGILAKAQLTISPLRSSYDGAELPSELTLYESDKHNRIQDAVTTSTLTIDELYQEETIYSFDITNYLQNELADSYFDPEKGLLISLPASDLRITFNRLIVDAENRNTKLKIYYLSY